MSEEFELGVATSIIMPSSLLREFVNPLEDLGVHVRVEERGQQVFAGVEWFLPTAVILLVTRKYFETLFEEAAKDHYPVLKAGLRRLLGRLVGPHRDIRLYTTVSARSPHKLSEARPGALSVYIEVAPGVITRFIYEDDLDESQHDQSIDAILQYIRDNRELILAAVSERSSRPTRAIIFRFDVGAGTWYHWTPRFGPVS